MNGVETAPTISQKTINKVLNPWEIILLSFLSFILLWHFKIKVYFMSAAAKVISNQENGSVRPQTALNKFTFRLKNARKMQSQMLNSVRE